MKKLMFGLILIVSCSPKAHCPSGEVVGNDNQCYGCNYGTPETAGSEFGYCSNYNSAGVACCSYSYYNWNNITCYPSEPWLCSDELCHQTNIGACIYVP